MGVMIGVVIGGLILLVVINDLKESIKIHKQNKQRKEALKKLEEESQRAKEHWRAWEEDQRKREIQWEEDQRKRETLQQECPQKLREMTEYYIHSDLLHTILLELCQGDLSNRPIEINVCPHMITAKKSENEESFYRFSEHRVPDLKEVADATVEASPIIAMSIAINHLLGNDYSCRIGSNVCRLELKRINTF